MTSAKKKPVKTKQKAPTSHAEVKGGSSQGKGPPGYEGPPGHHPDGPPGKWDPPGVRRGQKDRAFKRMREMQSNIIDLISQISSEVNTTTNVILQDEMTMTDVDREIPIPRSAGDARASQSEAGADTATGASRYFEGTHKQTADTNVEEALSLLSAVTSGNTTFHEALNRLNAKRTYDQAQSFDLGTQYNDNLSRQRINQIAEQALQNAVESGNLLTKQVIGQMTRHNDLAMDRQWNVDEQGYQVEAILRSDTFKNAMEAATAAAIGRALGGSGS